MAQLLQVETLAIELLLVASLAGQVREALAADPALEAEELDTARRELLRAQRSALWLLARLHALAHRG